MTKIPLVLLPGLLSDRTVWEAQIAGISDIADCSVPEWHGLDSLVAMAERVLESAPAKFALAGHSMGGRVAFEVYRRAGEHITHLALLDTNFPPRAPGEAGDAEARGRYELLELSRTQGMRAMCETWLLGMIPDYRRASDPELLERIIQMFCRSSPDDYERQIKALLDRPDAGPVLPTIRAKTLLLTGVDDQWSNPAAHETMYRAIAVSKLVVVPKCGHMSTMEQPEAVTHAFRVWLS